MPSGYADLGPCIAPSCRRDLACIVAVPLDEQPCGGYIKWRRRLARGGGAVHEDSEPSLR